jgi:putative pyruvate formate lyase activating enzyme
MSQADYPAYKGLLADGSLELRAREARRHLDACDLCPRRCGVDRNRGEVGFCKGGPVAQVASFGPHFGEEPPLVGRRGSGTIFLSGCNLQCCFCQNYEISHYREGREVTAQEMASIMLELEGLGCHNINLVTPTHYAPQILEGLLVAAEAGLALPLVYNCGGYESQEMLRLLDGVVDIYMPDFKFWREDSSRLYMDAPDYPEVARSALREMNRQVGDLSVEDGIAVRGLLVRHLVMPGHLDEAREIFGFLASTISKKAFVNVMDQYRPCWHADRFPAIGRRLSAEELRRALDLARSAGLERVCA